MCVSLHVVVRAGPLAQPKQRQRRQPPPPFRPLPLLHSAAHPPSLIRHRQCFFCLCSTTPRPYFAAFLSWLKTLRTARAFLALTTAAL